MPFIRINSLFKSSQKILSLQPKNFALSFTRSPTVTLFNPHFNLAYIFLISSNRPALIWGLILRPHWPYLPLRPYLKLSLHLGSSAALSYVAEYYDDCPSSTATATGTVTSNVLFLLRLKNHPALATPPLRESQPSQHTPQFSSISARLVQSSRPTPSPSPAAASISLIRPTTFLKDLS